MKKSPKIEKFLTEVVHSVNPDFEICNKAHPDWLLKIAGSFVKIFNKRFDTDYVTILFGKCWFPSTYFNEEGDFIADEKYVLRTLAHETIHEYDRKRLGSFLFTLFYLSPQILAVFSLLAIFAIWSPWWLLCLLFLGFLAPIPSPGRAYLEIRGYQMNVALMRRIFNENTEQYIDWAADTQFNGPSYYFMFPFKKHVEKKLQETNFEQDEIYRKILNWFRSNL